MNILVQTAQREDLEHGIFRLRDQLNNPGLTELLDCYPDLIQEYDLHQLLTEEIEIGDAGGQDVKAAGLLSCLLLLIHFYFDADSDDSVRSEAVDSNNFDSIRRIVNAITSEECSKELFLLVLSIVGIDYFKKYKEKMKDPDFVLKQMLGFDSDPEMDAPIDMMTWFALVRLFIESIFIFYNGSFESKKNQR